MCYFNISLTIELINVAGYQRYSNKLNKYKCPVRVLCKIFVLITLENQNGWNHSQEPTTKNQSCLGK